jgi:hypothetical protein
MRQPVGDNSVDERRHTIQPRVVGGDRDRQGIDISCKDGHPQRLRNRNGQYASARPDVERIDVTPRGEESVEHREASGRRGMVAGTECLPRVDLDRDGSRPHQFAIMASMHEETASLDGRQRLQPFGDPVRVGQRLDRQRSTERVGAETVANLSGNILRASALKVRIDRPGSIRALVEGDDDAILALVPLEEIRDAPRLWKSGSERGFQGHVALLVRRAA